MNLIRYADDFVINGKTKELLEGKIKPLVEQFLGERGLELSRMKTVVTNVTQGFDFLGQNVRRYPNRKLLIKPSKKNIRCFLAGIREKIKAALGKSAANLINELNPKIRGWANYHRHVVSKRTFNRVDHSVFYKLWQWARRRHPDKDPSWLKLKYFERHLGRDWLFFGKTWDEEGQPVKVRLLLASRISVKRHVKVRSEANPYAPAYETYFEKREADHMLDTFQGTRTFASSGMNNADFALCGSRSVENRVLLHLEYHNSRSRPAYRCFETASPFGRRSKGLSWVRGNSHAQSPGIANLV